LKDLAVVKICLSGLAVIYTMVSTKYLKNGLKAECKSVPQSKFSTRGARYKSSTFGRPLNSFNIDAS